MVLKDVVQAVEGEVKDPQEERIKCYRAGGVWDPVTETCKLPEEKEKYPGAVKIKLPEPIEEPAAPKPPKIFTAEERAEIEKQGNTIITDRFGEERIQTPQDIKREQAEIRGMGAAQALQIKEEQQARIQEQIARIGQLGKLDPAVEADINFSQAAVAGGVGAIPGLITGAGAGFAAGLAGGPLAPITVPIGVTIGAVAGAAASFVGGLIGNIKVQQRGELQAADIELRNARTNMRQLAMLASRDPANADVYISQYNQQLTRVHQARRQTKVEVAGDLNSWMEDGREQLADFDAFLQPGGIADVYGQKLAVALATGTPLSINGEGLLE